ncbi:MAG TPA: carboxypeptidase-like regulatory domain-containing protein [Bryobacteraceae bacterium]|jgi:hypothetical protein|nr:carboxypeptidase-like regulatory domain-containing protein [Bryobacteraceae bacterium]
MSSLRLASGFLLSAVFLSSAAAAVVSGTISDSASEPISGARVLLLSPDRIWQISTGKDGHFQFVDVPPGSYTLRASEESFKDGIASVHVGIESPAPLSVVLSLGSIPDMRYCGIHTDISYAVLDPSRPRLRGTLLQYSNSKPLKGAEISLWRTGERKPAYRTKSDPFGRFALDAAPGRYSLRISQWSYHEFDEPNFLLPRENSVFVNTSLLERDRIVACQ